jgi:hypothetical protein
MAHEHVSRQPDAESWDYEVLDVGSIDRAELGRVLSERGVEHWELVAVDNGLAYLKRPVGRRPTPGLTDETREGLRKQHDASVAGSTTSDWYAEP